jgi:hypothetical protein
MDWCSFCSDTDVYRWCLDKLTIGSVTKDSMDSDYLLIIN